MLNNAHFIRDYFPVLSLAFRRDQRPRTIMESPVINRVLRIIGRVFSCDDLQIPASMDPSLSSNEENPWNHGVFEPSLHQYRRNRPVLINASLTESLRQGGRWTKRRYTLKRWPGVYRLSSPQNSVGMFFHVSSPALSRTASTLISRHPRTVVLLSRSLPLGEAQRASRQ